jgi:hypothetical protein
VITSDPVIAAADFERMTGWAVKPEGACRGDVCVPLPRRAPSSMLDLRDIAPALRMPLVYDEEAAIWALGPAAGPALPDASAPDFTLPEWRGGEFSLSSLRGRKVALVAWAPW